MRTHAPPAAVATPPSVHAPSWARALGPLPARSPADLLDAGPGSTLLVVTAHPDDETFGAGATLARLALEGVAVHVLSLTAGEAAFGAPPPGDAALAARRRREFAEATALLGVHGEVLDLPDGALTERAAEAAGLVRDRVETLAATGLLSIWDQDPHPDHRAAGTAARGAAACLGLPYAGFPLWAYHWTDPATVDVAGRVRRTDGGARARDRRLAATQCYASQVRPFRAGGSAVVPPTVADWPEECLVAPDA